MAQRVPACGASTSSGRNSQPRTIGIVADARNRLRDPLRLVRYYMRWLILTTVILMSACAESADDAPTATQDAPEQPTTAATMPSAPVTTQAATAAPSVQIEFLMVNGGPPGSRASVTIRTDPVGVECDIRYRTPTGTESEAEGLDPGVTRGSGTFSWEWTISASTEPGTGRVIVICDGVEATSDIEIGP